MEDVENGPIFYEEKHNLGIKNEIISFVVVVSFVSQDTTKTGSYSNTQLCNSSDK